MSPTGLVQSALLVAVIVALLVLVQMAGGVKTVVASFKGSPLPEPAQRAAPAPTGSIAGVGMAGAAMSQLNSATTNSIERSMAPLDKRQP